MPQPIADAANLPPGDAGYLLFDRASEARRCFADQVQLSFDGSKYL